MTITQPRTPDALDADESFNLPPVPEWLNLGITDQDRTDVARCIRAMSEPIKEGRLPDSETVATAREVYARVDLATQRLTRRLGDGFGDLDPDGTMKTGGIDGIGRYVDGITGAHVLFTALQRYCLALDPDNIAQDNARTVDTEALASAVGCTPLEGPVQSNAEPPSWLNLDAIIAPKMVETAHHLAEQLRSEYSRKFMVTALAAKEHLELMVAAVLSATDVADRTDAMWSATGHDVLWQALRDVANEIDPEGPR